MATNCSPRAQESVTGQAVSVAWHVFCSQAQRSLNTEITERCFGVRPAFAGARSSEVLTDGASRLAFPTAFPVGLR